jgi:hypothetical protein
MDNAFKKVPAQYKNRSKAFKDGMKRGGRDAWEGKDPAFDLDACDADDATEEMKGYLAGWNEV